MIEWVLSISEGKGHEGTQDMEALTTSKLPDNGIKVSLSHLILVSKVSTVTGMIVFIW